MASNGLRSVGGLQVASGWLMQTPLGLFVLASAWLAHSQWVAYVNSIGFICYSQCGGLHRFYWRYLFFAIGSGWVTSILLALFVIASGWLVQIR